MSQLPATVEQAEALLAQVEPDDLAPVLLAFVRWCQEYWQSSIDPDLSEDERRGWDECLLALETAAEHVMGAVY
jgi:hypothetical protein